MMLTEHLKAVEKSLLSSFMIMNNSGHSTIKGTARESFVKDFLSTHINELISIGQGEIIGAESMPNESRNQFDVVLYKKNYPKLNFHEDTNAFLVESVIATIEIKSIRNALI